MPILRNNATESDLRAFLENNGYDGKSAKFSTLELKAVKRPGWVQVFKFDVVATNRLGEIEKLFGTCRRDDRFDQFEVVMGLDVSARDSQFLVWSDRLITHQREAWHWSQYLLMGLFLVAIMTALFAAAR